MYSYTERLRAVRLYIKLGKRMGATIRQLGYPTKNSLKVWYREFELRGDLPAGYIRTKPGYSEEQKRLAVEHYLSHGRCSTATRRALGYPCKTTLSMWIDAYDPAVRHRVVGRASVPVARSEQQKRAAVIDLCSRRGSADEVAQAVGISRQTLYKWKNERLGREAPASMTHHRELPPKASRPDANLVNTMLDAAIETIVDGAQRPVVHTDRGAHYRWPGWLSRMREAHLTRSMSRKACSPDNAACEGFFGRLKNEMYYPRSWLDTTVEQFIAEVNAYIQWYNQQRIKLSLGRMSPVEYRQSLGMTT